MMQVLRLENNRLECLPDNFGDLHSLIKLDVSTNCLRQLPPSMGRLKRIQRIDAANNVLTRVPPPMGHLKSLKEFNLKYNSLDDRYKAKTEEGLSRYSCFK
jgi:Leucine-rich repeat (LRR) protein